MLFFGIIDVIAKISAVKEKLPEIIFPFFHVAYFANPGIALSIPLPQTLTLLITGIFISMFIMLMIKTTNKKIRLALSMTLIGATSNFFDRLITGYTTDYLIFFSRSAINIADILILLGIGYCAWYYQKAETIKEGS